MESSSGSSWASSSLLHAWLTDYGERARKKRRDDPSYFNSDAGTLVTRAEVQCFTVGTGDSIVSSLIPAIESAEAEVIIVTCFWAKSSSSQRISNALRVLSSKGVERGQSVCVRICFSSLSIFQKLFHTASLNGHIYPSSTWVTKFGLPPAEELRGLDLVVKSIFVRPFSVMHPKFVIVDGKTVWLPSCNVSWEDWFEGCLELTGPVVGQFVRFWEQFWYRDDLRIMSAATALNGNIMGDQGPNVANTFQHSERLRETKSDGASARVLPRTLDVYLKDIRAIFLPSPHHVNPRFRPLPWQDAPPSPPTPLNTFLLRLITTATSDVYIQTPNLTAPPVLSVLLAALRRGVTVHIVTSERLMILEQLVTAGTTTSRCVRKLVKVHKRLLAGTRGVPSDVEHGYVQKPGALRIYYYQPCLTTPKPRVEPVQSHLKLTIVDGNITVLGSGNMDRASWYTSQELGVAFFSRELAEKIRSTVAQAMESRTKLCYSSAAR